MKIYKAQRFGSLMVIKAYIRGPDAVAYPGMLIDTGAAVTIIAQEILESVGCSPASASERRRIVTASGYEILPVVRINEFENAGKLLEAQRIAQRTKFDLEMLKSTGMCAGIENYSRYLTGRNEGEAPPTLFEYLPKDAMLFVDESHVSVPQVGGMFKGDRARKEVLSEHGFRLPSCKDNRPLMFEEWNEMRPQSLFISATIESTSSPCAASPSPIVSPAATIHPIHPRPYLENTCPTCG